MILTNEQIEKMKEAAKPLVEFLNDNFHPHVKVIVECNGALLLEGVALVKIEEFIRD